MIRFTQDDSQPDWHGYLYAVLLFLAAMVQSLFLNQYFHRCFTMGMNVRTSVIALIYSKARPGSMQYNMLMSLHMHVTCITCHMHHMSHAMHVTCRP